MTKQGSLEQVKIQEIIAVLLVLLLFVGATILANRYEARLTALVEKDTIPGMVAYVGITIVAVVIAPFSTAPLIPIASALWGWVVAALLSILGWVIGAQVAFVLARRFGVPLVARIVPLEKISILEARVPQQNLFWAVILLRMTVPVDILSYALGLFSRMSATSYFWATLIGVTPFAFVFAYTGTLSMRVQMVTVLMVSGVLGGVYMGRWLYKK